MGCATVHRAGFAVNHLRWQSKAIGTMGKTLRGWYWGTNIGGPLANQLRGGFGTGKNGPAMYSI